MKWTRILMIGLVLAVLALPTLAPAQNWQTFAVPISDRLADAEILLRIPGATDPLTGEAGPDTYRIIDFEDLLAGLVTFDDRITRYMAYGAVNPNDPTTPPQFTADTMTMAPQRAEVVGNRQSLRAPNPASGVDRMWIAIALPAAVTSPYIAFGTSDSNPGFNQAVAFLPQAGGPVTIGSNSYTLWVTRGAFRAAGFREGRWFFFTPPR